MLLAPAALLQPPGMSFCTPRRMTACIYLHLAWEALPPISMAPRGGSGVCRGVASAAAGLPVISLLPLLSEQRNKDAVVDMAQQLHVACRDVGFFYITDHGMSQPDLERLLCLCRRLFDLPDGAKQALDANHSALARGYGSQERGKHSCTPEDGERDAKESFTLGMERAEGDPRPPSPMHGPNQWPPELMLPGWRAEAEASIAALLSVARLLMRGLALALQLQEDFFTAKAADPVAQLCLFRYPPEPSASSSQDSQGEPTRGCGAHTDCGLLTFVAQDVPGIEVQLPNGGWHAAPVVPGALLVNLGDLFSFWTSGVFRSTVHRVVSPGATRHSAVWFCNADFCAPVEVVGGIASGTSCAEGSVAESQRQQAQQSKSVTAGEYILQRLGLMHA